MLEESLGGFFVDIKAKIDGSFDKSKKEIKALGDSMKNLVGTVTKTTGALVGLATVAGNVETKNLKLAQSIGISATELDKWKIAAGIAGTNADALVGSMDSIEQKMRGLKTGQVDMNLAKNLGFMGIGYSDFADMDADERMKQIFNKASGMQDQEKASKLVSDILGEAGKDYYSYLKLSGKSLDEQLAKAKRLNFTDERSKREAMAFNQEIKGLFETTKSLGIFIASKIGVQLTPIIRKITDLLAKNKELIKSGITGFVNSVGSAFNSVINIFERVAPIVSRLIDNFGGLDKVIMKVGIGFAMFKFAKIAGGVMQVVKSVGLLKGALMGIGLGALFLLIDDIVTYLSDEPGGEHSLIGWVIKNMDLIKSKFNELMPNVNFDSVIDSFKKLGDAFGNLLKKLTGKNTVAESLSSIANSVLKFAGNAVETAILTLQNLTNILTSLLTGNWKQLGKDLQKFLIDLGSGLSNIIFGDGTLDNNNSPVSQFHNTNSINQQKMYEKATPNQKKQIDKSIKAFNQVEKIFLEGDLKDKARYIVAGIAKYSYSELDSKKKKALFDYVDAGGSLKDDWISSFMKGFINADAVPKLEESYKKYKKTGKIEDGIISPNGRITQVSPQDWVIAAKDLGNVASAFMPRGLTNISSSMNSPTVINQNFTITASNRELVPAIKQQAYKGANDALLQNMRKSSNILQQMNGTR